MHTGNRCKLRGENLRHVERVGARKIDKITVTTQYNRETHNEM